VRTFLNICPSLIFHILFLELFPFVVKLPGVISLCC